MKNKNSVSASPSPESSPDRRERFIRCREVQHRTGLSRSTIWRWERQNRFPKRRRLGVNTVGWLESEVDSFLEAVGKGSRS